MRESTALDGTGRRDMGMTWKTRTGDYSRLLYYLWNCDVCRFKNLWFSVYVGIYAVCVCQNVPANDTYVTREKKRLNRSNWMKKLVWSDLQSLFCDLMMFVCLSTEFCSDVCPEFLVESSWSRMVTCSRLRCFLFCVFEQTWAMFFLFSMKHLREHEKHALQHFLISRSEHLFAAFSRESFTAVVFLFLQDHSLLAVCSKARAQ